MISTVAELDASIRISEPGREVPADAVAPYGFGDLVAVLFNPMFADPVWLPGMVMECFKPMFSRRFKCKVSIGTTINTNAVLDRIYCWEDGTSEELVRLNPEGNYVGQIDVLNQSIKSFGRTSWLTPGQRQSKENAYPKEP